MKLTIYLLIIAIVAAGCYRIGYSRGYNVRKELMTPMEVQEYLNTLTPTLVPLEIDGIIGPATQKRWDSVWIDGFVKECFNE